LFTVQGFQSSETHATPAKQQKVKISAKPGRLRFNGVGQSGFNSILCELLATNGWMLE